MTDPVHNSVLDNGLRVVTVELPHLHTGMIAAYVRAGSRHEDPVRNGVSHFLEHLFFRGSHGYPDGRGMNALVEDCGGSLNGVTTRDHGYYFTPVHPLRVEAPLRVAADVEQQPAHEVRRRVAEAFLQRRRLAVKCLGERRLEGQTADSPL